MRKVYLNHDGGVDDLVSLYLLLKMEDVELVGVGVIEADCYLEPAVEASKKIIQKIWFYKRSKNSCSFFKFTSGSSISKRVENACIYSRRFANLK